MHKPHKCKGVPSCDLFATTVSLGINSGVKADGELGWSTLGFTGCVSVLWQTTDLLHSPNSNSLVDLMIRSGPRRMPDRLFVSRHPLRTLETCASFCAQRRHRGVPILHLTIPRADTTPAKPLAEALEIAPRLVLL